jgi:hypothetical protein
MLFTLALATLRPVWRLATLSLARRYWSHHLPSAWIYTDGLWSIATDEGREWPCSPRDALQVDMGYWED